MAACWKMAGAVCHVEKEKTNEEFETFSSTGLNSKSPIQRVPPIAFLSSNSNNKPKCGGRQRRRSRSRRKWRKESDGSEIVLTGVEDDEEDDNQYSQTAATSDLTKRRIKKLLLCGQGLRNDVHKGIGGNCDLINSTGELSPTLAATILNWQQFNKDLLWMKTRRRSSCKSDSEIESGDIISRIPQTAPVMTNRPKLSSFRRQSLTEAINPDGGEEGESSDAHGQTSSNAIAPITVRSAVLPRRRLGQLPVAPSTDTGLLHLTNLDGRTRPRMQRRGAVVAEEDDDEDDERAIARSPLPLARTNAQLDLFANLNKEHATRYWSETAHGGEHIWIATGASTECYIGEVDCSKTGDKLKCAACHVIVHEGCLTHLRKMNFNCKLTYREAQTKCQKDQNFVVHHHWVHKWRQEGRCTACGKSFQSKFLNRELVAISCSWCKIAYHNKHGCFTMTQIEECCSMGPLKDVIIPPSWVIKLPPRRISTIRKRHVSNNYSVKKRKRSRKMTSDRLFVVKPQPPLENGPRFPVLIFVNPKSGGNKGAKILHTLQWLVNPRQVFDVAALFGPRYGLEMYRKLLPHLRVLVCGGDGTVGWVLSTLDSLKWPMYPPIGIVPLGTGNDLARTLGWGATYADDPMSEMLMAVAEETMLVQLDRWVIEVTPNPEVEVDPDVVGDESTVQNLPLAVMNNYFSIGADAHVALQFHESRSANPEVFNSRLKNRLFYGGIGTKDLFKRTWKDLSEHISIICDGVDLTWKVQELKLHCLLFLNIPRYAGGTLPWGSSHPSTSATVNTAGGSTSQQPNTAGQTSPSHSPQFSPPSYSDGRVEVLGFTSATLAALQVGGRGERLAQCSVVKIITRKAIPAQVDGEPCKLAPSIIEMRFHSRVPMLQRISSKATSRRGSSHAPLINTDPANVCGSRALYTSVLLRLPVAVISKADYDTYKQDVAQLLASAVFVGDITVESETDLDQVRGIVQRLLADHRDLFPCQNLLDWAFLDYISNDSVFRLNQSQESFQSVSDICNIDNTLLIMHPGFQKPLTLMTNGASSDAGNGARNERLCLLRDLKLDNATEAVRIVFSSEDEETKI